MKVVGVMLVHNEERFVERAILNVAAFCDRLIVCDHASTDTTRARVEALRERLPQLELHAVNHPSESHDLIKGLAGTDTWVFGVDGDELYDPVGLAELKQRLLAGTYADWWLLFGNVLNCCGLDEKNGTARGFLSPPCRSMTKLYNFALIQSWDGDCPQRLHGGDLVFRPGFGAERRCSLHKELSWEESFFRCLHVCFLPRTGQEVAAAGGRRNVTETLFPTGLRGWIGRVPGLGRRTGSAYKQEKYQRGPEVTVDVHAFFTDPS